MDKPYPIIQEPEPEPKANVEEEPESDAPSEPSTSKRGKRPSPLDLSATQNLLDVEPQSSSKRSTPRTPTTPFGRMRIDLGDRLDKIAEYLQTHSKPGQTPYPFIMKTYRQRPADFAGLRKKKNFIERSKKKGILVRRRIKSPFSITAAESTHLHSMVIQPSQCFELSTARVPQDADLRQKLGMCVTFVANECGAPYQDCKVQCEWSNCNVCPHQFRCDCEPKYFNTLWCAHIHVAQRMDMKRYGDQACLFVDEHYGNDTAKRHLRAFVEGSAKMRWMGSGLYLEQFSYVQRSVAVAVRVVAPKPQGCTCAPRKVCKRCQACQCQFVCNCEDFVYDDQCCEHVHLVAMLRNKNRDALFAELGDYGANDAAVEGDDEVAESGETHPEGSFYMEQEHEKSCGIDLKNFWRNELERKWLYTSYYKKGKDVASVIIKVSVHPQREQLCICGDLTTVTRANSCARCQICKYHYQCTCETGTFTICQHVHAVQRLEMNKLDEETPEEKIKHLKDTLSDYEYEIDLRKKFIPCEPIGPVDEAAGSSCSKSKTEPFKTESSQTEPSKTESSQMEPSKIKPSKTESSQTEPFETESSQMETSKIKPSKTESSQTEPSKTESSQTESSKRE